MDLSYFVVLTLIAVVGFAVAIVIDAFFRPPTFNQAISIIGGTTLILILFCSEGFDSESMMRWGGIFIAFFLGAVIYMIIRFKNDRPEPPQRRLKF
jgi:amino acid transporter